MLLTDLDSGHPTSSCTQTRSATASILLYRHGISQSGYDEVGFLSSFVGSQP